MPAYKSVVVGVHDSPTGMRAVELAALLAAETGVKLVLVAAYRGHPGKHDGVDPEHGADPYHVAGADQADRTLGKAIERCTEAGASEVTAVAWPGEPVAVLLDAVREHHADLLLVGSHGLATLGGMLLGSVPDGVLREASCDVLVVHTTTDRWRRLVSHRYRHRRSAYRRTIMVGVHDTPRSMRAVERAAEIAVDGGGRLVLAGAYEPNDRETISHAVDYLREDSFLVQGSVAIEDTLRAAEQRARRVGVGDVERLTVRGDAMAGLLFAADRYDVDLLVMGNHQMSGRVANLLSSISGEVTRKTATHVLLVH